MTTTPAAFFCPNLLIVGCGYLGMRVGRQAIESGCQVAGTTRGRFDELRAVGLTPVQFDWNDSRDLEKLGRTLIFHEINAVVIAVSHDRNSRHDRFASQVDGLARLLKMISSVSRVAGTPFPSTVYISTTGVYHQTGGIWVDEASPTHPTREGGRAHLQAEAKFRYLLPVDRGTILRLSGIYGPGRVPRAEDVRAGRPIASPPTGHLNLIHVDDAAAASLAAISLMQNQTTPQSDRATPQSESTVCRPMYVVSDDHPVVRREFYNEIARQTHSPEPTFIDPASDSGVRFRSETDKRVWNRRLKRDLLPKLAYPTYREGLRDVLSSTNDRDS